jgi:pimeloyl-ACP methyl ester carboxylesterase
MQRAIVDGVELEYELRGEGEPVVLIHWGLCAAWAAPLMAQPALAARYRLLDYHRAGFAGSGRVDPVSIARHAAHCAQLMRHLGIERAHVVGHSSSADIALQLALDSPEAVRTLALLEPARPVPETAAQAAFLRDVVAPSVQRFRAGDRAGAVAAWARGVFGPDHRAELVRGVPGGLGPALAGAGAFLAQGLAALQRWSFTEQDARRVTQPVLGVCGTETERSFPERLELLAGWLPHAETFALPGANHLLHVQRPAEVAEALAGFFARAYSTPGNQTPKREQSSGSVSGRMSSA